MSHYTNQTFEFRRDAEIASINTQYIEQSDNYYRSLTRHECLLQRLREAVNKDNNIDLSEATLDQMRKYLYNSKGEPIYYRREFNIRTREYGPKIYWH